MRILLPLLVALPIGCLTESTDTADRSGLTSAIPKPTYCAIASFGGPAFYAHNFDTREEAKKWLEQFDDTIVGKELLDHGCAAYIACPDFWEPICGIVSSPLTDLAVPVPQTFGNACELEAATRTTAGSTAPGSAKGETLYKGECDATTDPCAGKQCGDACDAPFASPLPTFCDADLQCVAIDKPACPAVYDCDPSHALCDRIPPACPYGYAPAIVNGCYGDCVPVNQCKCDPASDPSTTVPVPTQNCPDGYVCWAGGRCGPYVTADDTATP